MAAQTREGRRRGSRAGRGGAGPPRTGTHTHTHVLACVRTHSHARVSFPALPPPLSPGRERQAEAAPGSHGDARGPRERARLAAGQRSPVLRRRPWPRSRKSPEGGEATEVLGVRGRLPLQGPRGSAAPQDRAPQPPARPRTRAPQP